MKKTIIKKRIIFSSYDDVKNPEYGGGGAVAIHEIAKRLTDRFEIIVITGSYKGSSNEKIDDVAYKRIKTHYLGAKIGQLIFHFFLPFYSVCLKYDLWIESFTPPFSTSFLPIFAGKPVIGLVHMLSGEDMSRKYNIPFYLIEKVGLKAYDYFIVLNQESKDEIKKINKNAEIQIISNGVYMPEIRKTHCPEHILFLGRIEINQKGLDLLLKAFSIVRDKINYKLAIAGSGNNNELKKLKKIIESYDLMGKINLLGKVGGYEKEDAFRKSAFVVIPSRFETLSLVALEAMSFGLPVISFEIEGMKWISANCCIKAKPFSEIDLAQKMLDLSQDVQKREIMGDNGRQFALQFEWGKKAIEYENYILNILKND
ncbi:MAG: hypothetical protein HW401_396 [Parcubacteria group bacterium]|nr:hypothetical protein [Parcubacteria group bacterium]